jgi:hypothetical protein
VRARECDQRKVELAAAPGLIVLALFMAILGIPLSPWLGSLSASVPWLRVTGSAAWSSKAQIPELPLRPPGDLALLAPYSAPGGWLAASANSPLTSQDTTPVAGARESAAVRQRREMLSGKGAIRRSGQASGCWSA